MLTAPSEYASVQKHKSNLSGYAVFARSFEIFWADGAGYVGVAMRHVVSYDQPAGTKFSDWYAHWSSDS